MTGRIFLKLIAGVVGILLLAGISVDYFASEVTQESYIENLRAQLADKARMLARVLSPYRPIDIAEFHRMARAAGGRLTVIHSDGSVVADSEADPLHMENHRTRPEFVTAFAGKVGSNIRLSATVGVRFLYVAVPVDGGAIRVAMPISEIDSQVRRIRARILASTAMAFLPAILLAGLLARFISRRFSQITSHAAELARGNFRARLPGPESGEFGQLMLTLNETAENLQHTVEQLEREHAELEKVERVRKDFVINVSHELRTPLASIQGYTETLLDGALHDPAHNMRFLGIIRHNAERLARLTEDLLTLSRIEQKRRKFEFDLHSVNQLIEEAIEIMRPIADKRSVRLEAGLAQDQPIVLCDSEALSQILTNLLDNAIKYTPVGGVVTVGARPAGELVEIFVRDTGIGIPEEDLPRLFERFYRVDKARSREMGGTGLGLSIVKHLVAAHHGTIRVDSRTNEGSTFWFTVPEGGSAEMAERLNSEFTPS